MSASEPHRSLLPSLPHVEPQEPTVSLPSLAVGFTSIYNTIHTGGVLSTLLPSVAFVQAQLQVQRGLPHSHPLVTRVRVGVLLSFSFFPVPTASIFRDLAGAGADRPTDLASSLRALPARLAITLSFHATLTREPNCCSSMRGLMARPSGLSSTLPPTPTPYVSPSCLTIRLSPRQSFRPTKVFKGLPCQLRLHGLAPRLYIV